MNDDAIQPPSPVALKQGYEPPDMNYRGLVILFIIFLALGAGIHYMVWVVMNVWLNEPRLVDVNTSAVEPPARFPPPNLQPTEKHNQVDWQDLANLRSEKNQIFEQMGWHVESNTSPAAIPNSIVNQLAQERSPSTKPSTGGTR